MPHTMVFRKPCAELEGIIWAYFDQKVDFLEHSIVRTAKASPVLGFNFGDRPLLRLNAESVRSPLAYVMGSQTKPITKLDFSGGSFASFGIQFQPHGLYQLFGCPVHMVTDTGADAVSMFGPSVTRMAEQLGNCRTFEERIERSNQLLLKIYRDFRQSNGIAAIVGRILRSRGEERIDYLFRQTGLSKSTFERRFHEQVGMSAKLFSRIVRFQAALDMKAHSPQTSWTFIAQECGYFDQMHLIHDVETFATGSPGDLVRLVERVYDGNLRPASAADESKLPDLAFLWPVRRTWQGIMHF